MTKLKIATSAASLLAFSTPAWVHHSGAMFDAAKEQTIAGKVTEFNWTNPHSSFKVEVADPQGTLETWAIEMSGPQNLMHDGWKRSSIKPGDKVTVVVHPLRDGKPGGSYVSITLADGTTLKGSGGTNTGQGAYEPAKTP